MRIDGPVLMSKHVVCNVTASPSRIVNKIFCLFGGTLPTGVGPQNLIISKLAQYEITVTISSQSDHNILSYPVHKQTIINKEINKTEQISDYHIIL